MEKINMRIVEKQLQNRKFYPSKGFKIESNDTVILYELRPYFSDEITQLASVQVINQTNDKILLGIVSSYTFSSFEYEAKEVRKKAYLLFRDPEKGGKLIYRSVPFGIADVPEAMRWI